MRGCLTCRQRHLKCDKTGTECLRCQRSGRQCIPAPAKPEEVTFRHGQNPSLRQKGPPRYGESDLSFPDDQIWVHTSSEVAFEDETDRTAADYHVLSSAASPSYLREASESQSSASMPPNPRLALSRVGVSPVDPGAPRGPSATESQSVVLNHLYSSEYLSDHQKLNNVNEAFLLRHFRSTLGAWMDVCDHERHFSTTVVERAPSCALLLYACLAIAARHLSHTTNTIPSNAADGYHERCIAILLPVLENSDFSISIEILLASTVILRFFEQLSSHTPSSDLQRHLLAGSVYISSHVDCAISGGLAEASFWVFVKQDIQFALLYRNPLRLTISPFEEKLRQRWEQSAVQSDRDWSHKAIWLLAETINYCYGATHPLHMDTIDGEALKRKICAWEAEKPESFQPLHFSPANPSIGRPFPLVWFTSSAQATAVQHICMTKALIHQHELQTRGPSEFGLEANQISVCASTQAVRTMLTAQDEVIKNLGIIFGIALSAEDDPPVRIMACHALCACGSWIRDPLAQNTLLDLLRRTEADNGWPWSFAMQKFSQDWRAPR